MCAPVWYETLIAAVLFRLCSNLLWLLYDLTAQLCIATMCWMMGIAGAEPDLQH